MALAYGELFFNVIFFIVVCLTSSTTLQNPSIKLFVPINSTDLSIVNVTLLLSLDIKYKLIVIFENQSAIPESIAFTSNYPSVHMKNTPVQAKENTCTDLLSISEVSTIQYKNKNYFVLDFFIPSSLKKINSKEQIKLYVCAKYINYKQHGTMVREWISQGPNIYVLVYKLPYSLPLSASICIALLLLILSGLFSGLNIGLMSLQLHELEVISNSGTPTEQRYAKNIIPLRKLGNILLVCILLSNTAVNSTLTIIIDKISTGAIAVAVSTICIMVIGEIIPQSICTRYSLAIGSTTRYIVWFFIAITSFISLPLGYLLNYILGPEPPTVVGRQQLLELIRVHGKVANLDNEEVGIISGALNFRSKVVADAMVTIDKCFLLSEDAILDFETITNIVQSGFSRIPIYSKNRNNIVGLLLLKDLTLVDPDDKIPLLSVVNFYKRPIIKVFSDITLDKLFHEFKNGVGHLAVVIEVKTNPDGDPYYNSVGIITLEDIIEEIMQTEITDETDFFNPKLAIQNQHKESSLNKALLPFFHQESITVPELSPNMVLTVCQFLSSAVPAFSEEIMSKTTLKSLVTRNDVIFSFNPTEPEPLYLYKHGIASDYFTLILEGKVEVTVGQEKLLSICGPFSYFGISSLKSSFSPSIISKINLPINFYPDYTVKVISNLLCLRIKTALYFDTLADAEKDIEPKQTTTKMDY